MVFGLAKILRPKEFRQTNDLRAFLGRVLDEIHRPQEILLRIGTALHLDECDLCVVFCHSRYFTESAGTMSIFSITTRVVGLLFSPMLFRVTGVSPIFPSTSSPLINLPKVVY